MNSVYKWRTIDVVVAAVLAVAFGVVFWAWNLVWNAADASLGFFPPLKAIIYGVWLIPAVLAPLIIRKAGAGLLTEALAATVSALLGSQWGVVTIWSGLTEGLGGELAFAAGRYRRFGLPTSVVSGALAGLFASTFDTVLYYPTLGFLSYQVPYVAFATLSSAVIAGLGAPALVKALAATGVLDRFPAGRGRALV
ncbi:MAG TPA: ECF transporter S component [Stackebrandtia sp.]|jgi:energy-coupling factor transport system substrate-specific component|uniref:ECF transporter S component n=1 Tax=Stackebrandtia sp. TaxID=2023065 RepID=UPI002D47A683|nr:ECF transporter S component [Stackebrandtia sp.]HZE41362.1 ECF transporter S component [Stackebrandtia sp.]